MKKILILSFLFWQSAVWPFANSPANEEKIQTNREESLKYENSNNYYLGFQDGVEYIKSELSDECVKQLENITEHQ